MKRLPGSVLTCNVIGNRTLIVTTRKLGTPKINDLFCTIREMMSYHKTKP